VSDPEWPSDEYDSYIDGIPELLARGESAEAIAQHLARIEEDYMGTASDMSDLRQIAEKLKTTNISDQS